MTAEAQAMLQEGWDVVAFAPGGRIARVITFWGGLPPMPCLKDAP